MRAAPCSPFLPSSFISPIMGSSPNVPAHRISHEGTRCRSEPHQNRKVAEGVYMQTGDIASTTPTTCIFSLYRNFCHFDHLLKAYGGKQGLSANIVVPKVLVYRSNGDVGPPTQALINEVPSPCPLTGTAFLFALPRDVYMYLDLSA
jgi:hypothetical protein